MTGKYRNYDLVIPQHKRAEYNRKALFVIESESYPEISAADIFNIYTGAGGLHGLNREDYANYHEYSEAKKTVEQGQFFTPPAICRFLCALINPGIHDLIADLTSGAGGFFNYAPVEANCYGNELDPNAVKIARFLYPEAGIQAGDIRFYRPEVKFDIVFGNPPFNLRLRVGGEETLSQLFYFIKAAELLKPAGLIAVIVPSSFLSDELTDAGAIRAINERFNFIAQFELPSNAFKSFGVANFETKIMIFQKKSRFLQDVGYRMEKVKLNDLSEAVAGRIYSEIIQPVMAGKETIKAKLFFENLHSDAAGQKTQFHYRVEKLLFDIKRHPKTVKEYSRCAEYVTRFHTQEKPPELSGEEWEKQKITEVKVISYLEAARRKQNQRETDRIALVKTAYGLKLKAYSGKTKYALSQYAGVKEISFNQMIIEDRYPFEDQGFQKLVHRKANSYHLHNTSVDALPARPDIRSWLDEFTFTQSSAGLFAQTQAIRFNEIQKTDLEKILQRNYAPLLNWQMGCGKTLAGIAWFKFWGARGNVRNVFIVGPALAINLTWETTLKKFGEPFLKIESWSDLNRLQPGQTVLISFDLLVKYQSQIKEYIKRQSQKIAVIIDEADELTNYHSERTRAALNCFRRVKYKLLETGTVTRNNINELYPQLELLYNNSVNFLCRARFVYRLNKEQELEEELNPYYLKPFPARRGLAVFKSAFCPHKITVFGIKKHNQDIYHIDELRNLITRSILTRTFKEIAGDDKYSIITHRIGQNEAEQEVYRLIIEEFYRMIGYFRDTGNDRKEGMLKIIRQIQLLIKSTSIPHYFKEYGSPDLPAKYHYIFGMLDKWHDQKVALGTVFLDTALDYYRKLRERYPERPIFLIKGDVSFKSRRRIIAEFEETKNGILISTQQALKSSVNIPTCNRVIIESFQWNIPKIQQYFFRFIRFNSREFTEVHFVSYDYTIEQNLIALLMAKERLNEFIRTLDFKEQGEIYEEFGVDLDILNSIIEKEKDSEGRVRLTWGQQKVS